MKTALRVAVIGGGAAGFFGALRARAAFPRCEVEIFESAAQPLGKVRISGGGRCNVTNACFDLERLAKNYPRGQRELPGILARFGPRETVRWFEHHGVPLKTEPDGRMFPVSDRSQSVVDCFINTAQRAGIQLHTRAPVADLKRKRSGFELTVGDGAVQADRVLLASGSSKKGCEWLSGLGHQLVEPVPSLFTFNIRDSRLTGLEGVSVQNAACWLEGTNIHTKGPVLVTHWGLSGPAILRLSAWAARELHALNYQADLRIDWLPELSQEQLRERLLSCKSQPGRRKASAEVPVGLDLPKRLWKQLAETEFDDQRVWAEVSNKSINRLVELLKRCIFQIQGKGVFKEEFVTAGGVPLHEADLTSMESKLCPGLFLAGEVLNIDGITGGFNFQSAWSTAWLAGSHIGQE